MKDKKPLQKRIVELWDSEFREGDNWFESETKEVLSDDEKFKFLIVFNRLKGHYYKTGRAKIDLGKPDGDSPFIKEIENRENYVSHGHFVIRPTLTPLFRGHMILIADEIRPGIRAEDLVDLLYISSHTDCSVSVNLKGSGATIPTHFHAQSILSKFPILSQETGASYRLIKSNGDLCAYRVLYPAYGVRICTNDRGSIENLGTTLESLQQDVPFNMLFYGRDVFVYPRAKELPSCFESWTMGGQEMNGLFCTRNMDMFNTLDCQTCEDALREVTYSDQKHQIEFEKVIMDGIENGN